MVRYGGVRWGRVQRETSSRCINKVKNSMKLSKEQLEIINEIYDYFKTKLGWPLSAYLHFKFGEERIKKILKATPQLIYKPNEEYRLTDIAFWECLKRDKEKKEIILEVIDLAVQKFRANPMGKVIISSQEIQKELNLLNEDEVKWTVRAIIILGLAGGTYGPKDWTIDNFYNIAELAKAKDAETYIEEQLNKQIKREKWVERREKLVKRKEQLKKILEAMEKILKTIKLMILAWMKLK
jgi:hypothetical protein